MELPEVRPGSLPDHMVPRVTFTVRVEPPLRPPGPAEDSSDEEAAAEAPAGPVTRKEIRTMSAAEQRRYASAVQRMMQNVDGVPESSPFFKLASMHGWPGKGTESNYSYCEHRQETFPGWHRAYLCAFEQALQDADRALGNDGRIALPYWDVIGQPELHGEVVPEIVRRAFPNGTDVIRSMLRDPRDAAAASMAEGPKQQAQREKLWADGYQIVDDATLKRAVEQAQLAETARQTLWIRQHFRAASTFGSSNTDSMESPHDMIHVLSGYPMRSLMHAAFHPAFWLHHCNIDRLYEAYLHFNPRARLQFESNQEHGRHVNKRRNRRDRFDAWLEPFTLPRRRGSSPANASPKRFMPRHTFHIGRLGYAYDQLQTRPNQALTAPPILASIEGIDVNALPTGYTIFVFVFAADDSASTPPLGPDLATLLDHPNLGGVSGLFTGRADVCAACQSSEPFDIRVDISAALRTLRLTAATARLAAVVETAEGEWLPMASTPIPLPILRGGNTPTRPRNDSHDDDSDKPTFEPNSTVTYCVEAGPGELPRGMLLHEISQMFACWAGPKASGLRFKRLPLAKAAEAQLVIGWADHSETNPSRFDGPGGKLAEASPSSILLDASETWLLHGAGWGHRTPLAPGSAPCFYVAPVVLHEIGHALGLSHSVRPEDVMAPFYSPDRIALSSHDKSRARAIYGVAEPLRATQAIDVSEARSQSEYLAIHRTSLEADFSEAVTNVIQQRPPRPLKAVAEQLLALEQRRA